MPNVKRMKEQYLPFTLDESDPIFLLSAWFPFDTGVLFKLSNCRPYVHQIASHNFKDEQGFISNRENFMVGMPRLRQARIRPGELPKKADVFKTTKKTCLKYFLCLYAPPVVIPVPT